jgi:hypothetical protein
MWDDTWTGVAGRWGHDNAFSSGFVVRIRGLNTWDRGTFRSQMSHEQGNETSESGRASKGTNRGNGTRTFIR